MVGGSVAARVKALLLLRARKRTTSMETDLLPGLPAEQNTPLCQSAAFLPALADWLMNGQPQ
jgi:hypothetical protein